MTRLVTMIFFASMVLATGDVYPQCLKYDPNVVTLDGSVYSKDFPGPPDYESIRQGDERMRYWILRLNKSICVDADASWGRADNVREVQLVFLDSSFYKRYRGLVRKRAHFRVVGLLYHQHSGYHVREVLITVQKLVPLRG